MFYNNYYMQIYQCPIS